MGRSSNPERRPSRRSGIGIGGVSTLGLAILSGLTILNGCGIGHGLSPTEAAQAIQHEGDPNARYDLYRELANGSDKLEFEERQRLVTTLVERLESANEPTSSLAMICRALGRLRDPAGREPLKTVIDARSETIVRAEACLALGRIGHPDDANTLARILVTDPDPAVQLKAIEGLQHMRPRDPRITQVLLDRLAGDRNPAIRLATLEALRALSGRDYGIDPEAWQQALAPTSNEAPEHENPEELAGR